MEEGACTNIHKHSQGVALCTVHCDVSMASIIIGSTRIINSSANNTDCCYSSCELKRRFSTNGWDGNTLPFGHSFLVASSRDPVHRFLYKSARPFVDQVIAKKVMNEMLQF